MVEFKGAVIVLDLDDDGNNDICKGASHSCNRGCSVVLEPRVCTEPGFRNADMCLESVVCEENSQVARRSRSSLSGGTGYILKVRATNDDSFFAPLLSSLKNALGELTLMECM